jgi:hypothetical protein
MAGKKRSAASGLTSVVGGMLVGLDEQLLRATPRAEILVKRGDPIRGTSSEGGTLHVTLPDAPVRLPPDPSSGHASDEPAVPNPAVAEAGTELPTP